MAKDLNGKILPKGIIQRADGLYMGRFQYEGELYPPIYDKDWREVERKLNDLRYEVTHQMYSAKSKLTLDEWFEIWLKEYRGIRVKEGTKENYRNAYNGRIKPVLGKKRVTSIRMEQIQRLYNKMAEENYATETIKATAVLLYGMFKQAEKVGLVSKNVAALATIPKAKGSKERVALTVEEQALFQEYVEKYSKFPRIYLVALCTGMRNGEVRGLTWDDVDFEKRVIHITGTLKYIKGKGTYRDDPKTKTSKRDIPMLNYCYDLLMEEKKLQEEAKELAGTYWIPYPNLENLVFTKNNGQPISREMVTADMNRIFECMKKEGKHIPQFTFHALRHTFATRGLEQGIDLKVMQTILGHTSLSMTSDLYSHVLPTTKSKEMEKLEEIF